jgi:hypothetical protein
MKLKLLLFFVFVISTNLFAQGENNKYPMDSVDIQKAFNMMGIEVFKFPLNQRQDSSKLKIKIESYRANKLIESFYVTKDIPASFLDLHASSSTVRVYSQKVDDKSVHFEFIIGNINFGFETDFIETSKSLLTSYMPNLSQPDNDSYSIGLSQISAFTQFQPQKGISTPVLIWYGADKKNLKNIHFICSITTEEILKMYDFVILVKFELE